MANVAWKSDISGDWGTKADWDDDALPGAGDAVAIDTASDQTITMASTTATVHSLTVGAHDIFSITGGALTLSTASTFGNKLNLTSGSLIANGAVTVSGLYTQSDQTTLGGAGLVTLSGGAAFNSANQLMTGAGTTLLKSTTLVQDDFLYLDNARVLENHGTMTVNGGSGGIFLGQNPFGTTLGGGTLLNDAGATIDFNSATGLGFIGGGAGTTAFTNNGTFENTAPGETIVSTPFTNNGLLKITAGEIDFTRGGTSLASGLQLASGTTLAIGGGQTFTISADQSTLGKAGSTLSVSNSATLSIAPAAGHQNAVYEIVNSTDLENSSMSLSLPVGVAFVGGLRANQSSLVGSVAGTPSVCTVQGSWTGGYLSLSNVVANNSGQCTQTGFFDLNAPAFDPTASNKVDNLLHGNMYFDGSGTSGEQLIVPESFTPVAGIRVGAGTNTFVNAGALQTQGSVAIGGQLSGSTSILSTTNTGAIEVLNGETQILGSITGAGTITVDKGAIFVYDGSATSTANTLTVLGPGTVTLTGGSGADIFKIDSHFGGSDTVNGGTGAALDQLVFTAAGTVTVSAFAHVSHIEELVLANGANVVTPSDAMVGSADDTHVLTVVGGSGNDTVKGIGVTTAANSLHIIAGAGNDALNGGAGADIFVFAGANLTGADTVNGGTGTAIDTLDITSGSVTAANLAGVSHIEKVTFGAGNHSISLTDALAGSADDSHLLTVVGNSGIDSISALAVTTSTNRVRFEGLGGADHFYGSAGADTFVYTQVSDSTGNAGGTAYDTLSSFNATADHIDLPSGFTVSAIVDVNSGALSSASFDTNMHTAINAALGSHEAVLFHATSGTLSGHEFLVVNPTGTTGYVSGADYVLDITGATNLASISTSVFV